MKNQDIDNLILEIKKFLRISHWLTPTNYREEERAFFKKENYNPHFIYPSYPEKKLKNYLYQLNNINILSTQNLEEMIVNDAVIELKMKIELLLARGASHFTQISKKLYQCQLDSKTINLAKKDLEINEQFASSNSVPVDKFIKLIKNELKKYDLREEWKIIKTYQPHFRVRVKPSSHQILVSDSINWEFSDYDGTLAHEIDGHVIRQVNAQRQSNPLLKQSLPFYLKTEEGLASYLSDYCSISSKINKKHHAIKYLATIMGIKSSFRDIFQFFRDFGFSQELAFQRSYRIKRGFEDTSLPGCFIKEAIYYEGLIEVKDFIKHGENVEKLFLGKVAIKHLPYINLQNDIIIPKRFRY